MFSSEEREIENEINTLLVKSKSSWNSLQNRNAYFGKTVDFLQQQEVSDESHLWVLSLFP